MDSNTISINRINAALNRPSRIVLLVAFVSSIVGMSMDLIHYFENHYRFLIIINIVGLVFFLAALGGFLARKISMRRSAIIMIHTMVLNILMTFLYSVITDTPDWPYEFLRGTLVIALFVSLTGLILQRMHINIINLLYTLTVACIWIIAEPNFVTKNALFFILIIAAYSYAILMFMEKLKSSLLGNQQLQQLVYQRDKEVLKKDNELVRERALRLQETLDLKNRELLSNALILTQHLESRTRLLKRLRSLDDKVDEEAKKELLAIMSEFSSTNGSLKWSEFQKRFEDVHQDFYLKIANEFPDLSPAELKLAAFIKLGLSTKEISALTSNTISSLEVARSRLRKKLKLQQTDNMITFLSKF